MSDTDSKNRKAKIKRKFEKMEEMDDYADEETYLVKGGRRGWWSKNKMKAIFGLSLLPFTILMIIVLVAAMPKTYGPFDYAKYHLDFYNGVTVTRLEEYLEYITSTAHIAGSSEDKELAEWIASKWRKWGIDDAHVETYYPLLSLPVRRSLETVAPYTPAFKASLTEPAIASDPTSSRTDAQPPFLAYSATGDVTGELVYAHYGRREDYAKLDAAGIDLKDKIVIVRYGQIFRGLKVQQAESRGAIGVIIYSDPIDDGFKKGAVYPDGPWRPKDSVQRGSAQYLSTYGGDPLTPGQPANDPSSAIPDQAYKQANIPKIPCLPISYGDAEPFLKGISGGDIEEWKDGGIDGVEYAVGPGPISVRLNVEMKTFKGPIYNVMGSIPGTWEPDQKVILGNHHDAWTFGAADPSSGTSAMMELVRGLGLLLKDGWKPRRTIILGSWSGEEYGLIGSTEYVEDNYREIKDNAVVYLNVDVGVAGAYFSADATPNLNDILYSTAFEVELPSKSNGDKSTIYSNWARGQTLALGLKGTFPKIFPLGSGSDFTPFFQHAGVPSMDCGFSYGYPTYHSNYDSFTWMKNWVDGDFKKHQSITRFMGALTLKFADYPVIPFTYVPYVTLIRTEYENVKQRVLQAFPDAIDQTELRVGRIDAALDLFTQAAIEIDRKILALNSTATQSSSDQPELIQFNKKLQSIEKQFLAEGLFQRPWYKHVLFAPGIWKGYGGTIFPGLVESLEVDELELKHVKFNVDIAAAGINKAAKHMLDLTHH